MYMYLLRVLLSFLLAVLVGVISATVLHTQFVLARLAALGVEIPFAVRLQTTWHDMVGLGWPKSTMTYGFIIMIGLAIAFAVMSLVRHFFSRCNRVLYPVGGALAMATALVAMYPMFEVVLIAGARGPVGFAAQCFAGVLAGSVFAYMLRWSEQ